WCGQFPPISDGQLEVKYGDSSPMGLLWRFMQFSPPHTAPAGVIQVTSGGPPLRPRPTPLRAACPAGAPPPAVLPPLCFDLAVKPMSGALLLMALTLIAPDVPRLAAFFLLGRPVAPRPRVPLFGRWRRVEWAAVVLRTVTFGGFAALQLLDAYRDATA